MIITQLCAWERPSTDPWSPVSTQLTPQYSLLQVLGSLASQTNLLNSESLLVLFSQLGVLELLSSPGASLSLCRVRAHFTHFSSPWDHITSFPALWYFNIIFDILCHLLLLIFDRRINLVYVAPPSPEANAVSQIFKLFIPAWLFISFWYWLKT